MILDNCQPDSPVRGVHILRTRRKIKNKKCLNYKMCDNWVLHPSSVNFVPNIDNSWMNQNKSQELNASFLTEKLHPELSLRNSRILSNFAMIKSQFCTEHRRLGILRIQNITWQITIRTTKYNPKNPIFSSLLETAFGKVIERYSSPVE